MKIKVNFSPANISGLVLWLKSDVGLYQDTGTSLPAVSNNDPVGHWLDQSASGNNATFVSGVDGDKGYLVSNVINGRNAVGFNGNSNASLTLDQTISPLGTFTLYVVGKRLNSSVWVPLAHHNTPGVLSIPFSDNNVYVTDTQSNSISHPYTGYVGAIATRTRWLSGPGAQDVKFASTGMPEVSVGVLNHNLDWFDINQVGGRGSANQWNGDGNLYCEILLYNRDVPTSDPFGDSNLLKYLNKRWGVSIS